MTVITVTLYSNPLSYGAIAECPTYLDVYALFICISYGEYRCVRAEGCDLAQLQGAEWAGPCS